jgi:hypothetical protein
MGTHYLIDAHTSPIANSEINDVRFSPASDTSPINGNFVVRVSDSLDVVPESVTGLNDLLTKKYQEVLAANPGFSNIVYDDMLDATGVDLVNSVGVLTGDRGSIAFAPAQILAPPGPFLQTAMVVLGGTPAEAIITWEVFTVSRDNSRDGRMVRSYVEEDTADAVVSVSFDNGASTNVVTDGSLFNIPAPDQGNQMILYFGPSVVLPPRRYIGSWAVIY